MPAVSPPLLESTPPPSSLATGRQYRVAVIGNPNTGKTTLFNALTGLSQHTGNYPGVTVESALGEFRQAKDRFLAIDLPGTYSLAARAPDEMVAVSVLLGRGRDVAAPDVILCVVDATNLDRNLYLATQVVDVGRPVVVALTMTDLARKQGLQLNIPALEQRLGVPVVPVHAAKRTGLPVLRETIQRVARELSTPQRAVILPQCVAQEVETLVSALSPLKGNTPFSRPLLERVLIDANGLMEQDLTDELGSAVQTETQAALDAGAAVVTDVGSVKAPLAALLNDGRFVAGHPIAGSEQDGVSGANADIFSGSVWVLCPTADTDDAALSRVKEVVSVFGAQVLVMSPERHDELVAVVSHVPHLTAATLMRVAANHAEQQRNLLRLAAGGFRDMTRVAAGQPSIWPAICTQNSKAIVNVLDDLLTDLAWLREAVANQDEPALLTHLEGARVARRNLPTTAPDAQNMSEMRVPVLDRPGELAAIAVLATELDVNIFDLEIAHSSEGPQGVVVLLVESETAPKLSIALRERGYRPSIQPLG